MKKNDLHKMLSLIDDEILSEADPSKKKIKIKGWAFWLKMATMAACLLLVFNIAILPAVALIPSVIMGNKIGRLENELLDKENAIKDVLEKLEDKENSAPDSSDTEEKIEYFQNITNVQIQRPDGGIQNISLSSPILGASSEYKAIIDAMVEASNGRITSLDSSGKEDENVKDEIQDAEDKFEDALGKNESEEDQFKDESSDWLEGDDLKEDVKYEETTDLQVNGVIEGDLIKRSSDYAYYLSGSTLRIYSVNYYNYGFISSISLDEFANTALEALQIPLEKDKDDLYDEIDRLEEQIQYKEIFLSSDLKTVTVVIEETVYIPYWAYGMDMWLDEDSGVKYTVFVSVNVEDPENAYISGAQTFFGEYKEARLVNGDYLLFTSYKPEIEELIIPQYHNGVGFVHFPLDKITMPSTCSSERYLLAFWFDASSYYVKDLGAYASYDGDIYVSGDNIYLTREYYEVIYENKEAAPPTKVWYGEKELPDGTIVDTYFTEPELPEDWEKYDGVMYKEDQHATEIMKISYKNGAFETAGTINIEGYLKDRYSLSENGKYLYAATTVRTYGYYRHGKIGYNHKPTTPLNASIFLIDTEKMEVVSSLEHFAPDGERVYSVKYDGHYAYVCTAKEKTDPVFFFNMQYPKITFIKTDDIPGFSTSLINYGNGILLGIGEDEYGQTKVEIYKEGKDSTVVSLGTYVIRGKYSTDYKALYVNREYGLFGFGITDYKQTDSQRYVMLQVKNGVITEVFNVTLRGANNTKRVVLVSIERFFLFAENDYVCITRNVYN